jgi:hypothetical protein
MAGCRELFADGTDDAPKRRGAQKALQRLGLANVTVNADGALEAWRNPNSFL